MNDLNNILTNVEQDPEGTVFEPAPLGARQRMVPTQTFVHRVIAASPQPTTRPAYVINTPVKFISMHPAPTFAQGTSPFPTVASPDRAASLSKLRTVLRPYAIPLCGAAAVLFLTIAYIAKPATTHHALPVSASVTAPFEPAPLIVAAPIVAAPAPTAAPIEPTVTPIVEPTVAEIAPTVAPIAATPVVKPVVHHRPTVHQQVAHQSKPASATHRRMAALDAADLSSPLGRLRPR